MLNNNSRKVFAGQAFFVLVTVLFASFAFGQAPAPQQEIIYVVPTCGQAACQPVQPAPQPQCCQPAVPATPLGKRLHEDVSELSDAEQAVLPLRGTTAPVVPEASTLTSYTVGEWAAAILLLLFIGAIIMAGVHFARGAATPNAPTPLPAGAPAAGHCVRCGTGFRAAARYCVACGRVLPLILMALAFWAMSQPASAQALSLPDGPIQKVDCPAGIDPHHNVCFKPAQAVQAVVPTAPRRVVAAQPVAPKPSGPSMAEVEAMLKRVYESSFNERLAALKAALPPPPASIPSAGGVDENHVREIAREEAESAVAPVRQAADEALSKSRASVAIAEQLRVIMAKRGTRGEKKAARQIPAGFPVVETPSQ